MMGAVARAGLESGYAPSNVITRTEDEFE